MRYTPSALAIAIGTLGCISACSGGSSTTDESLQPTDASVDSDPPVWAQPEGGRIYFDVGSAVLSAVYYPADTQGAPSVVLMGSSRSVASSDDYPDEMAQRLHDQGWTVLITEQRGTGQSTGEYTNAPNGTHVLDLDLWGQKLQDDGYGDWAIVDPYGPISTALVNGIAGGARYSPLPCAVTLSEASNPNGLGLVRDGPTSVRRMFQYTLLSATQPPHGAWAESMREYDPGNWVWHPGRFVSIHSTPFVDHPEAVDQVVAFHADTIGLCGG